jgi:hypothetical protein
LPAYLTTARLIESGGCAAPDQVPDQAKEGENHMKVQSHLRRMTTTLGCAGLLLLPPCVRSDPGETSSAAIAYEVVGQVLNPSAQESLQYGYLNQVRGLDLITTAAGVPVSESTALFTFYNDTTTEQVINSGPIRVIDRTGTGAIYFGSGGGNFADPDTFRQGTPVQTFTLRHQVVIDTSTGYFTTAFEITITSAKPFQIDRKTYRLGHHGGVYRLNVFGKLAQPTPPSAYIAGAADGAGAEKAENH